MEKKNEQTEISLDTEEEEVWVPVVRENRKTVLDFRRPSNNEHLCVIDDLVTSLLAMLQSKMLNETWTSEQLKALEKIVKIKKDVAAMEHTETQTNILANRDITEIEDLLLEAINKKKGKTK